MTRRYREPLDKVELVAEEPVSFTWRGRRYGIEQVLGHWFEDEGWWRRGDGLPQRIERTDLWRVETCDARGVYEIVQRAGSWRLDRVWD